MFTYVKAKNFKSLKDIEFNLNKTKQKRTNLYLYMVKMEVEKLIL